MINYNVKPQWAIDLDIYHADSTMTEEQLVDYTRELQAALSANGNQGVADYEESVIAIFGDANGDNKRLLELLNDCYRYGCWVEVEGGDHEITGEEWDALEAYLKAATKKRIIATVEHFRTYNPKYEPKFALSEIQLSNAANYRPFREVIDALGATVSEGKVYFPDADARKIAVDYFQQFKDADLYNIVSYGSKLHDGEIFCFDKK